MVAAFDTLIYSKQGNIGHITLNRPQVLNVYNMKMRDELWEVLSAIKEDDEVEAVIINGAGEKAFCAGADLTEFLTAPSPVTARNVRWERDVWGLLLSLPQPVIAALHGYVLGSGFELALCCDVRIASEDTIFGFPELSLGIIPAAGGTQTLPRTIGYARALDIVITGRRLNAHEAYEMRLVNRVVPRDQLMPAANALAQQILQYDAIVVATAKEAVVRGMELPLIQSLWLEAMLAKKLINKIAKKRQG
jgi:enoyl-CoA hydratase/carnithine racemase